MPWPWPWVTNESKEAGAERHRGHSGTEDAAAGEAALSGEERANHRARGDPSKDYDRPLGLEEAPRAWFYWLSME